jgi:hypothetical protein
MDGRWHILLWTVLVCGMGSAGPPRVEAQSVIEIYQRQYYRQRALDWIRQSGERVVPRLVQSVPAPLDSIMAVAQESHSQDSAAEEPSLPPFRTVQRIPKLARGYFERRFEGLAWVFVGANRLAPLDTMMTRELRARLEAQFGKPTRTLVDDGPAELVAAGDIFQFEYWFVLDDEIPFIITDVNGPFERGIAVSTAEPYSDVVLQIRDVLLKPILDSEQRAPFVDYYYDDEVSRWYRTGYDGDHFFLDPVKRPGLNRPIIQAQSN